MEAATRWIELTAASAIERGDPLPARVAAGGLGGQILAADRHGLRDPEFEIAHALAAEAAAEAGDGRLADADARGHFGDGGFGGEVEIGEHHGGEQPVGLGAFLLGCLQARDDIDNVAHHPARMS